MLGERRPKVLPVMEVVFTGDEPTPVYDFEAKLESSQRVRYEVHWPRWKAASNASWSAPAAQSSPALELPRCGSSGLPGWTPRGGSIFWSAILFPA